MTPVGGYISRENDLLNGPRRPWHLQAACCQPDVPTAWFFPDNEGHYKNLTQAKNTCAGCAVAHECRAEHLHEQHGIYFGTTPKKRQQLRESKRGNGHAEPKHGALVRAVKEKCRCELCLAWKKRRNRDNWEGRLRRRAAAIADVERSANAPSAVPGAVSSPFAAPGTSADLEDAG